MSLEYRNEEAEQTAETVGGEDDKNYQRAVNVFPLYSIVLIVCLIAVFACQFFANYYSYHHLPKGVDFSGLLAGFDKQLFYEGQYWRILTGASLHGGLIHLAFNCYALYALGRLIETLSNRVHLAIVFLLSAIGGGVLSLIFLPDTPSVGASGGIIGFLGYMTIYGFKRRKLLPAGFLSNMLFNVAFIAVMGVSLNLSESANMPKIDNWGHLGGLLAGALYGLIQIPSDLYKDPRETGSLTRIFGYAALGIFILTCAFSVLILLGVITILFPANR